MKDNPNTIKKYADILYMEHPTSVKHPRMSIENRAAQFAPFAALTGYDAKIAETARLTNKKIHLTEDQKDTLNLKFQIMKDHIGENVSFTLSYFVPDERKSGGSYLTHSGTIKKIDFDNGFLMFQSGETIPLDAIVDINSEIYRIYGLDF